MHIVFPTFELAPVNPGGAGVLISGAVRTLADAGFRCTALCAFPASEVERANRFLRRFGPPAQLRALELGALAPEPVGAFSPWEANSERLAGALETLVERERVDMVEVIDYTGLGAGTLRARAAGRLPADLLVAVRIHGTLGQIDDAEGVVPDEARRRMHAEEAFALRQADRVLAPTKSVGSDYAVRYGIDPARLVVSPPPMALLLDGLGPIQRLPDPHHFLFYGKLQEVKGCDLFVRAAVQLIHEDPEAGWRFTLVGRDTFCTSHGRMTSACLSECVPEDCAAGIEFVDQIQRDQLPEVARTVAAAVVPSRSESFCLAAHELRSLGLPLVVPEREPFIDFFHPETGCLNFDGSVESLAAALRRFSQDPELRRLLRAAPLPTYPPFGEAYAGLQTAANRA